MPVDDHSYKSFYNLYHRFLPDLRQIESLDLNQDHGIEHGDDGRKFGLEYLYSLGGTGHRFVAACVIPMLPPDQYPIALVDEEQPVVDVFASSVTTWLPCYVLYQVGSWLNHIKRQKERPPSQWLEDQMAHFLAEEEALRAALQAFSIPGRNDLLTTLVTLIRQRNWTDTGAWQPATFLKSIEGTSPLSEYRQLADSGNVSLSDWQILIHKYPFYNKPLFHLFAQGPGTRSYYANEAYTTFASNPHSWTIGQQPWPGLPAALAYDVFQRRIHHDSTGIFDDDLLDIAARQLHEQSYGSTSPLFPLIEQLAEKGSRTVLLGNAFFEAGQRWEAQGKTQEQCLRALTCYENAIIRYGSEEEDWHWDALARIRALAATLDDEHYQIHLENYPMSVTPV